MFATQQYKVNNLSAKRLIQCHPYSRSFVDTKDEGLTPLFQAYVLVYAHVHMKCASSII